MTAFDQHGNVLQVPCPQESLITEPLAPVIIPLSLLSTVAFSTAPTQTKGPSPSTQAYLMGRSWLFITALNLYERRVYFKPTQRRNL